MSYIPTGFNVLYNGQYKDIAQLESINTVNFSPNSNLTMQRQEINYSYPTTIGTNNFTINIDGVSNMGATTYTFGKQIQGRWTATGIGTANTLATSTDGFNWSGLGISIFSVAGYSSCWNGIRWVAVGQGASNTIAYSYNGLNWTGVGTGIFSTSGNDVEWNGKIFTAVGQGSTNTIATSYDGINWTGLGKGIFSTAGNAVDWNGFIWTAAGAGTNNTLAYTDVCGNWIGAGTAIFGLQGNDVLWNGIRWIAVGQGPVNSIAYSPDGINWTGLGNPIFSNYGYGLAWSGSNLIATGSGTNAFGISPDGITWSVCVSGNTVFADASGALGCTWNGSMFVSSGKGGSIGNTIATSTTGVIWSGVPNSSSIFSTACTWIAYNSRREHTIKFPTHMILATGNNSSNYYLSLDNGLTFTLFLTGFTYFRNAKWNGKIWTAGCGSTGSYLNFSYDGIIWYPIRYSNYAFGTGASTNVNTFNNKLWVITTGLGSSNIYYSYDGLTYLPTIQLQYFTDNIYYASIIWNGKIFIFFPSVNHNYNTGYIMFSYDGIFWNGIIANNMQMGHPIFFSDGNITSLIGAYGTNITFDASTYWYDLSSNGYSTQGDLYLYSAYNGKVCVFPGTAGTPGVVTKDGINFYPLNATPNNNYSAGQPFDIQYGVVWTGTVFFGAGQSGTSWYSPDGYYWIQNKSANYNLAYIACNNGLGSVYIQQPCVSVGSGTNTISYSADGIYWQGLGVNIFTTQGNSVAWNGAMWVAVGTGTNSIAYSYDGTNWTGLGNTIITTGNAVAWNGTMWVITGTGVNTIIYSTDGINWKASANGNTLISTGYSVVVGAYSVLASFTYLYSSPPSNLNYGYYSNPPGYSKHWVIVGVNSVPTGCSLYSLDGINWTSTNVINTQTSCIKNFITTQVNGVAYGSILFIALGSGGAGISYSSDSVNWYTASSPFTTGYAVAFNGIIFIAVGTGTYSIAYSLDGVIWTGITGSATILSTGRTIAWNGKMWVAGGVAGTNTLAYSFDGSYNWYSSLNGGSVMTTQVNGVASNSTIGPVSIQSSMVLNNNGVSQTQTLEVVADKYYQTGYNTFTASIGNVF